jgi:hypothetical protein
VSAGALHIERFPLHERGRVGFCVLTLLMNRVRCCGKGRRRIEDVVARVLKLAAQHRQIDVEQAPLPRAHLAGDNHGLGVGAIHQRYDRPRHLVDMR